jgi:hypothetical protein
MPRTSRLALVLLPALACGDASGGTASTTSTPTGVDPTTGAATVPTTGSADLTSTSGDSEAATTGAPKLDVPDGQTTGAIDPGEGCPSVDILFVIDNSGSMADNQDSLINSFPGFIAGVQAQLAGATSYHIGVVTTDIYPENPPNCIDIGDLITQTGGPESSGMQCTPFATGTRFLDEQEPDIAAKFACMGKVGTGGSSDERPIRGMLDALEPQNNSPQGCNALFARPDALLVVVLITDEDDVADGCDGMGNCMSYGSGGDKYQWYDELLSYRNGVAENIVVLALIGRQLDNPCGAVPASKLLGFANMFDERGFIGDICADDYAPFFSEALPVIGEACLNWVPPN